MKMSLEELKARSENCFGNQKLFDIANNAKSPTAAHDLAIKAGFSEEIAKACRYLAMIKRDYSKEIFESYQADSQHVYRFIFSHWVQTANRLDYLQTFIFGGGTYVFNESDAGYLEVIKEWHRRVLCDHENMIRKALRLPEMLRYISEVEILIKNAERGIPVDYYSLKKTTSLFIQTIMAADELNGARVLMTSDSVWLSAKQSSRARQSEE